MSTKIDRLKISLPQIELSPTALQEVCAMKKYDWTLKDKFLRIQISGKGCSGFKYSIGFTEIDAEDFLLYEDSPHQILMDPFTSFYLQNGLLDFEHDHGDEVDDLGFVVTNFQQDKYRDKFWKKSEELTPPLLHSI
jgi:iron-sulfur cluster insertion protein